MARDNYSYRRYIKEQAKKKKKEEKLQRKIDKKNAGTSDESGQIPGETPPANPGA